jgi:type II secretory pathway component PulC
VVLMFGCEAREPSPAAVPARVVAAPGVPSSPIDPAVYAAAVRGGVRQRDANQAVYEVDAFLLALVVEDLLSGRPSVVVRPSPAGSTIGYEVTGVREGSVYAAIGLLDGDIVEAINDIPLDGPGRGLEALAGSERGARLQVTRAGVSATRELRVAQGLAWSQVLAARAGLAPPEPEPLAPEPVLEDMPSAPAAGGAPVAGRPRRPGDEAYRPPSSSSSSPSSSSPSSPAASPVQCSGDACTVARRDFDAMVADPDKLLRQVQVSEARGGYRLSGIRAGSQVSQLGFRNGDVLISVNGTRLDDQLGLLGLYGGLESTRSYNVTYERGGARHTRTVRLRD